MAKSGDLERMPPLPGGSDEKARRDHVRKRRRILTGQWEHDLERHLSDHFDPIRKHVQGKPDMSTNVFRSVVNQLSKLYSRPPTVHVPDEVTEEQAEPFLTEVDEAGWWQMATRLQRLTIGLRECLVRPSWSEEGGLMFRIVTPDMVYAEASANRPDQPNYVVEARPRIIEGEEEWTWDVADLRDLDNPYFRVYLAKSSDDYEDITADVLGDTFEGAAYPFRDEEGEPVMPYVLYHAQRTGELWDTYEGMEMVEGSLTISVLWTYWLHNTRDCAWAQKWTIDAFLRGTSKKGKKKDYSDHSAVTTDPSSVMQFRTDGQTSGSIGQWNPPVDPKTLGDAIADFESRLSVHFDIGPNDFERTGQAESGYAISIKRDAVREAQRQFEPQFNRGDSMLLTLSAIVLNASDSLEGGDVEEAGYSLTYPGLPKTAAEIEVDLTKHEKLRALGLESLVDAYMDLHPGVTREKAIEELLRIKEEDALIAAGGEPEPDDGQDDGGDGGPSDGDEGLGEGDQQESEDQGNEPAPGEDEAQ